jgi:heat shock protein HslJ
MRILNYIQKAMLITLVMFSVCFVFPSPSYATTSLEGSTWILKSGLGPTQVPDSEITMEFEDGYLGGSTGCNSYSAKYTLEPKDQTSGKIQMEPGPTTIRGCEGEIGEQEFKYFQALEKVKEYTLTDDSLVLPYPSPWRALVFTRK